MIKTLYEIGKIIQERHSAYFKPWENPFPNEGDHKMLVCSIREGELVEELSIKDFKSTLIDKVLYRPVQGANGTNLVPTLNFYIAKQGDEANSIRKLVNKIHQSLKGYQKKQKYPLFSEAAVPVIQQKLEAIAPNLEIKKGYLFTIKLNDKWLSEYEENQELFEKEAYEKYYFKKNQGESKSYDKVCAVTYKESKKVWGYIDTLGFTLDSQSFSRNGFDVKQSYKMFPVSPEAVKVLEGARKFVDDKMTHSFSGMKYFIVPHFIGADAETKEEVINLFIDKAGLQPLSNKNSIIGTEKTLHEIVEEEKLQAGVYYDIFFYVRKPGNAQFLIKAHLQDVMPSRLRKIFGAKKANEKVFGGLNRIHQKKKEPIEYYMNLYRVKPFFAQTAGTNTIFHPYFFTIVEAIFHGSPLQKRTLFKYFVEAIQKAFLQRSENASRFYSLTNQSFALYDFFIRLQLIPNQSIPLMENQQPIAKNWQDFLAERAHFFESDYEKGVFLTGALTQKLIEVQRKALNNEPFLNQLNGLRINEKLLEKLWPRLLNKMREYEIHNYTHVREMEAEASRLLMSQDAGKRADLNDRISYVFTLGMSLQRYFRSEEIAAYVAEKAAEKEAEA